MIIGTLTVHLAAEVCRRGAVYLHIELALPEQLTVTELNAEQLRNQPRGIAVAQA